jgi:uncharacterized membrane protein
LLYNQSRQLKYVGINTLLLLLLSLIGGLMVIIRFYYTGNLVYGFLIWNLILAWIPLVFSLIMFWIHSVTKGRTGWLFILGIIWLLFYPNAPYMITDFIHFQINNSFLVWFDFVIYSIFVWTSFFIGFSSVYLVFRIMKERWNMFISCLSIILVLFLSSFGIYLGRFIRWNSWDAFINPLEFIYSVLKNINIQSVFFSVIFGTWLTLTYAFLYSISYLKIDHKN